MNNYGVEKQFDIWIEEMAELMQALTKIKRYNFRPDLVENAKEEMVDVEICLDQLRYAFGVQKKWEIKYRNSKLNRQRKRMKEEANNEITNS